MGSSRAWLEVDKEGLAKVLARHDSKAALVWELLANCWDERGTRQVTATVEPVKNKPLAWITVEDDNPTGWRDLADSYRMFAPSYKKQHADVRGRFNVGEKLVLALCEEASIATTTGTVIFDTTGRHKYPRRRRSAGSQFRGLVRVTRAELADLLATVPQVIPPENITTTFQGEILTRPSVVACGEATLPTEIMNDAGELRPSRRKTTITLYAPRVGESPTIFEMGIPVVSDPDLPWHIDVNQKIPLTIERNNVTGSFRKAVYKIFPLTGIRIQLMTVHIESTSNLPMSLGTHLILFVGHLR